jgi:hypothetical protein
LERPGWLETFRSWIPGYAAKVNGRDTPVKESPNHLVMFAVPAGASDTELRFAGTTRLWTAFAVSALGWLGVLVGGAWKTWRDRAPLARR